MSVEAIIGITLLKKIHPRGLVASKGLPKKEEFLEDMDMVVVKKMKDRKSKNPTGATLVVEYESDDERETEDGYEMVYFDDDPEIVGLESYFQPLKKHDKDKIEAAKKKTLALRKQFAMEQAEASKKQVEAIMKKVVAKKEVEAKKK